MLPWFKTNDTWTVHAEPYFRRYVKFYVYFSSIQSFWGVKLFQHPVTAGYHHTILISTFHIIDLTGL